MKILDLGCGKNKLKGAIGVDIVKMKGVDVVHDLNEFPYPFPNDRFDMVNAHSILEHLEDIPKVMSEIHRVSKDGAKVKIHTPHWKDEDAFTDLTHRHYPTERSFDSFSGFILIESKRIWGKWRFWKSHGLLFILEVVK